MRYSPKARLEFTTRLGVSWRDLASYLDIPSHEIARFDKGHEADEILRWMDAHRVPDQLPEALDAIGRTDLADELRAGLPVGASSGPGSVPVRPRSRTMVLVVAGVVVLVALTAVVVAWANGGRAHPGSTPTPDGRDLSSAPCTSGATCAPATDGTGSSAPQVFEAHIYHTMDVNTNTLVGVKAYRDPTENGRNTEVGYYVENDTVFVVCQLRGGREITDLPWQDRPLSTRVWYKLTVPGPQWVPSIYIKLLPLRGQTVPSVPPDCGG